MAKKNAVLNIIFGADTKELDKALQGVAKRLRSTADDLNGLGQSLSLGLTAPIVAFGALATKNAVDSAKAIAQVEAAVKSTGGAAGRSVSQLEEMATGLQRISLYDDDQILKEVTANLLTFTNVTGTQFDKAQVAILNLSTRLGTDLTSASVQVGKALNDPIKGVTALGRAGVQFTAEQKELITTLTESGDVAGAQAIILGELETQFGGAAEAAANVDPYTQLANEIGNLSEDFGVIINDAIRPLVRYVREAVDAIKGWSDATKTTVLVIGGLLAALGPTLIAVGALINSYTTIKGALLAAKAAQIQMNLATLANPYVAAAAALAVLTLAMLNYKTETELAAEAKAKFDAQLEGKSLEDKYNIVQTELNKTIKQRAVVTDLLAAEQERLRKGTVALSAGAAAATAAEKPLTVEYAKQIEALDRRRDELAKQAQGIRNEIKESKRQTQATRENTEAQRDLAVEIPKIEQAKDDYNKTLDDTLANIDAEYKITGDLNERIESTAEAYKRAAIAAQRLGDVERAQELKELMRGQQAAPIKIPVQFQEFAIPALNDKNLKGSIQPLGDIAEGFRTAEKAAQEFAQAVDTAVEEAAESMAYNFGEMLGTAMATGDGMQGLGRMVLGTLADLAVQVGKIAIGVGISVEGIKKALQSLNPVLAVAAGIALVALGSYARTRLSQSAGGGVPAFAQGGLVTGPTLAMVGDNRSGKEAIIPFERMGEFLQMAGAGQSNANVTVTGRLQGRDLVISNERTTFNRNRTKY
jgi:hypothetical protein